MFVLVKYALMSAIRMAAFLKYAIAALAAILKTHHQKL